MEISESYLKDMDRILDHARQKNIDNLMEILGDNQDTVFGKKHGFAQIHSLEEYQEKVPISTYEYFEEYAQKEFAGESGQLTAYPIVSFCTSSGSNGNAKIIPVSEKSLSKDVFYADKYRKIALMERGGRLLHIGNLRTSLEEGYEKKQLLSEILGKNTYRLGYLYEEEQSIGGYSFIFNKTGMDYSYAKLWMALLAEDLTVISSAYVYDVLQFTDYLKKNAFSILEDIRKGSIPEEVNLPEKYREYLLAIPVSKERLKLLEEELGKGFDKIGKRIWPSLSLVIGISAHSYELEENALRRCLGDVDFHYLAYACSEMLMGYPLKVNSYEYALIPGNGFYEFISEEEENCKVYLPHELEVGKCYEPVITTYSGLYRYRVGDLLICRGFYKETPLLEYKERRNLAINLAGEKTSFHLMNQFFHREKILQMQISEYMLFGNVAEAPYYYSGVVVAKRENLKEEFENNLDAYLMEQNWDYEDLREIGSLKRPKVYFVSPEEYQDFIDYVFGDYKGHNKPIHILRKALYERASRWSPKERF